MAPMDDVALRYLLLGLRVGRHVSGLIGSYTGPHEIAEAVAGEDPAPPAELHAEALRLSDAVAELPTDTPLRRRRAAWLADQLIALSALARRAGGEEIGFNDLAEELYDVPLRPEREEAFAAARRMVGRAISGGGSLLRRLLEHERRATIPAEEVVPVLAAIKDAMRRHVRAQLWLPREESVELAGTDRQAGEVDHRYLGSGRSRVVINVGLPWSLAQLAEVAAEQCYPGQHAEAAVKDALLVTAGHAEATLRLHLAPESVIRGGIASYAREVVMSDAELALELERLSRRFGLKVEVNAELALQRARRLLQPAIGNAALLLNLDGQSPEAVRTYLMETALLYGDRLEATMQQIGDPTWRSYPFTWIEGRRLIGEWLVREGQTQGYARLLAEQLTPGQIRSAIGSIG